MGYSGPLRPLHLYGDFPSVLNTSLTIALVFVHKKDIVEPTILKYIQFLELMETSLVHTRPGTIKIDPFNGTFFKRWQKRVYFAIDVGNLVNILTNLKPKSDSEDFSKWENGNKQVRHAILSTLTNELFDTYCQYKVTKEIWDALTKKYIVEDAKTQKYAIGNFIKFQMTEDRDVSSQIHEYHMLVNNLVTEEIISPEPFMAGYLIKTLPDSWKD